MTPHDCLKAAFRNLDSALSDLRAGGSQYACDGISSAAYWAMEYWLRWHGLDAPHRGGWATMRQAFLNALGEGDPLRGLAANASAAHSLEWLLLGPADDIPSGPPRPFDWEAWRDDVAALAQATISLIDRMPMPPECPQAFRLSLDPAFDDARYHLIEWRGAHLGASINRRERPECKADGAQGPRHIMVIGEGPSTAQRSNRGAQQVNGGAHLFCTCHNPYLRTVHPSLLVPGFERWPRFWRIADRIGLWHWPRRFDNETGTGSPIPRWRLEITHNGQTIHTEAPAQHPTDRRVAALFQAVERVLGVGMYW